MIFAATTPASDIPWVALAPFILAFVVGLVLLLAGRRVMRTAFTGVGLIVGAAAGWALSETVALPIPNWAVIIVPAIIFAALASLAFKLTIAVVMATVLGVAAPIALITAGEVGLYQLPTHDDNSVVIPDDSADGEPDSGINIPLPEGMEDALPADVAEWLRDIARDQAGGTLDNARDGLFGDRENAVDEEDDSAGHSAITLSPEAQEQVDRASQFVRDVYAKGKERWDGYPQSLRYNLMLSAAVGALLGLLLGALAPTMSASVASSGAGSAICLMTASIIAARLDAAASEWLPNGSGMWLMTWLVVAIIGLVIQWTTRPKPVDKSR